MSHISAGHKLMMSGVMKSLWESGTVLLKAAMPWSSDQRECATGIFEIFWSRVARIGSSIQIYNRK